MEIRASGLLKTGSRAWACFQPTTVLSSGHAVTSSKGEWDMKPKSPEASKQGNKGPRMVAQAPGRSRENPLREKLSSMASPIIHREVSKYNK